MEENTTTLEVQFGIEVEGLKTLKLKSTTEELREFVTQVADSYVSQPVTKENLKVAKETKAKLNKVKDLVEGKLKSVKKEMLKPWDDLNTEIKGILNRLNMICAEVDDGIEAITDAEKAEKRIVVLEQLQELRNDMDAEVALIIQDYFNEKWLNKTTNAKAIEKDYKAMEEQIKLLLHDFSDSKYKALLVSSFKSKWDVKAVFNMKTFIDDAEQSEKQRQSILKSAIPTIEETDNNDRLMKALFWIYGTKKHIERAINNVAFADAQIKRASSVTWATDEDLENLNKENK